MKMSRSKFGFLCMPYLFSNPLYILSLCTARRCQSDACTWDIEDDRSVITSGTV